jgi:lysophospholipase L1-like esterase
MTRSQALAGALAVALAACGSADARDSGPPPNAGPLTTPVVPAVTAPTTFTATPALAAAPVTTHAAPASTFPVPTNEEGFTDRRVFLLGDSVLEATSAEYYDTMAPRLERLGWEPTIDADRGRNTEQAGRELRRNREELGGTVVVLIGHNDPPAAGEYRSRLEDLLEEVRDVPRVLLLTLREFDEEMVPLNGVVRSMPRRHANVELVEWADVVADTDGALVRDGLHLTERGAELLASVVASALGPAPGANGSRR